MKLHPKQIDWAKDVAFSGGKLTLSPATTSKSPLNLGEGSTPNTPQNGDIWVTSSGVFARINGSTVSLSNGGGGGAVDSVNGQTGIVVLDADDIDGISVAGKTGDYSDLLNRPELPTKTSDLENDSGFITSSALDGLVSSESLSAIATSGSASDISTGTLDLDRLEAGSANQVLTMVDGNVAWASAQVGASSISDLTDVVLTNLSNGQVLAYDNSSSDWINITPFSTPSLTGNAGKVLSVNGSSDGVEWKTPEASAVSVSFRGCMVTLSGLTGVNYTGGGTPIPFDSEVYDYGNWHDNSTNNTRLTVPTGVTKVRLSANVRLANFTTNEVFSIFFSKNGSFGNGAYGQVNNALNTTGTRLQLISPILEVSPGDYFTLSLQITADTSIDINTAGTWFCIEEIGRAPMPTQAELLTALTYTPLNKAGDTMGGALILAGAPTVDLHASTKKYVDDGLNLKANLASPTFTGTVSGITKSMVGLGNVDNTSDADKPISDATQEALDLKADASSPTFTGTVSGITKSMVGLGDVDNTSDVAKPVSSAQQAALDLKANLASPTFTGTVSGITAAMVGLGNVDNTTDLGKPISTATQTALDGKQATLVSGTSIKTINGTSLLGSGNITVSTAMSDLTDVVLTSPSNNQIIRYNGTNWVNSTAYTVPSAGTTNQILLKSSSTDGDFAWATIGLIPVGGTSGQALVKSSNSDYALTWTTISTDSSTIFNGISNVSIGSSGGNVNVSVAGVSNVAVVTPTGLDVAGSLTTTGGVTLGSGTGGNISGANSISATSLTGTIQTASQPNITSLGTLTELTASGNITQSGGFYIMSSTVGIASAGSDAASATALTTQLNVVSTVSSGTGVIMPVPSVGMRLTIINTDANDLLVYPSTGTAINVLSPDAAYTLTAGATMDFIATSTTQWYSH